LIFQHLSVLSEKFEKMVAPPVPFDGFVDFLEAKNDIVGIE